MGWAQAIRTMSAYPAPVATAELRVPVPAGLGLNEACQRIAAIAAATPRVLVKPVPTALLDRSAADHSMQIVVTFAPDGDMAALVKNDILRTISEQLEPAMAAPGGARQPVLA